MKISAFTTTFNSIKNDYPFIESIKSFLPILDELIVVDGGSTDGTIEAIEALNDNRIKIICDEDTKWEEDWCYTRMGKNFDRGFQECTGDWIMKFDIDYIAGDKGIHKVRGEFEKALDNKVLTIGFTRLNFILIDRYFVKSKKTLAVNMVECKSRNIPVHYGLDIEKWGYGYEFIGSETQENGIHFGSLLCSGNKSVITSLLVFNYDYSLYTEENAKQIREKHFNAVQKFKNLEFKNIDIQKAFKNMRNKDAWGDCIFNCKRNLKRPQFNINLEGHPEVIQDRIKKLTPEHQGFNCWNLSKTKSTYY